MEVYGQLHAPAALAHNMQWVGVWLKSITVFPKHLQINLSNNCNIHISVSVLSLECHVNLQVLLDTYSLEECVMSMFRTEFRGSMFLQNIGIYQQLCIALQPRRLMLTSLLLQEPQISSNVHYSFMILPDMLYNMYVS